MSRSIAHTCQRCGALPGAPCSGPDGNLRGVHRARIEARNDADALAAFRAELAVSLPRLHHPPRSRSEAPCFVPPARVRDPQEPAVPHPVYAPIRHRPARWWAPWNVRVPELSPLSVAREGGGLVVLSCGRRVPAFRRAE